MILWLASIGVSNAADEPKRPSVREPELLGELLRRAKADQDARHAIVEWMTRRHGGEVADEVAFEASLDPTRKAEFERFAATMRRVDAENTGRLGEIVERHGWL